MGSFTFTISCTGFLQHTTMLFIGKLLLILQYEILLGNTYLSKAILKDHFISDNP